MFLYFRLLGIVADRSGINDIRFHVQERWEVDLGFVFFFSDYTFLFESFEVKNQHFWSSINTHFFSCQLVLFAVRAIPLIASFKLFRLAEVLETV